MSVSTSVQLIDQMTSPILKIADSVNHLISDLEGVQRAGGSAFSGIDFNSYRSGLDSATASTIKLQEEMSKPPKGQEELNKKIREGSSGMDGLTRKVIGLVGAYASMRGVGAAINLADQITGTTARLDMIVDDGGTVPELEAKIRASANRSRADYLMTADVVAKMQSQAGQAFSGNDEVIAFTELLNKQFVIAGNNAQQIDSVMYNLTQAMGSGVLRGQDLNAVMSNTPQIAKAIADYLETDIGMIREMAAEGQISADVVKNAMLASADEINAAFESMPMTFRQVGTLFKNQALVIFDPILKKIGAIANSEWFKGFIGSATNALQFVANVTLSIFDAVGSVGRFVSDNWAMISPIVYGVIATLLLYAGYLAVTNGIELVSNGIKVASVVASYAKAAATGAEVSATVAATAAQWGLNTALLASPVTWILLTIIAIIAAIYGIVAAINHFTGSSISATGVIFGAFAWLGAAIWNIFLGAFELVLELINYLVAPFTTFANFIGNVFENPISSVIYLFQGMADTVLGILQSIASALDFVFGSNLADAVAGWRSGLKDMADGMVAEYAPNENYQKVIEDLNLTVGDFGLERLNYGGAYKAGYSVGEGLENKLGNFMPSISALGGGGDVPLDFGQNMSNNIADTAGNTKKIADSVELSEENLKYMRDIAEREVVNRFTTAEVNLNMGGISNNVSSNMDLDGVVNYITSELVEAVESTAGGMHY